MDNRIFSSNISDSLFNTTLIVTTILVREGGTCSSHQLLASPALRLSPQAQLEYCSLFLPPTLWRLHADSAKERRANL